MANNTSTDELQPSSAVLFVWALAVTFFRFMKFEGSHGEGVRGVGAAVANKSVSGVASGRGSETRLRPDKDLPKTS